MDEIAEFLLNETNFWLAKAGSAILIFAGFYILSLIIKKAIKKAMKKAEIDNHLIALLTRLASITLIIFGIVTALGTLGINVSAIVAGLGLTGFALGFALKDTISNLLSGILILLYQPFKIGSKINIAGFEGEVIAIDLRYTELNSDGIKILIPNSKLFTDPIKVLSFPGQKISK